MGSNGDSGDVAMEGKMAGVCCWVTRDGLEEGGKRGSDRSTGLVIVTGPSRTAGCKGRADGVLLSLLGKERLSNVMSQDRTIAQVDEFHSW
jgi:hypothetical protein